MLKNMQKKFLEKSIFKGVLLDFQKSRVPESKKKNSQKLIFGLKMVQGVFKTPLKTAQRLLGPTLTNVQIRLYFNLLQCKLSVLVIW